MNIQDEIDFKKRIQGEINDLEESIEEKVEEKEEFIKVICSINMLLRRRKIEEILFIKTLIDKYEQK